MRYSRARLGDYSGLAKTWHSRLGEEANVPAPSQAPPGKIKITPQQARLGMAATFIGIGLLLF